MLRRHTGAQIRKEINLRKLLQAIRTDLSPFHVIIKLANADLRSAKSARRIDRPALRILFFFDPDPFFRFVSAPFFLVRHFLCRLIITIYFHIQVYYTNRVIVKKKFPKYG